MTCPTCHDTRQWCRTCEHASDACRCEETGCSASDAQELEPCEECGPSPELLKALQTIADRAPSDSFDAHREFVPASVVYDFERELCADDDCESADKLYALLPAEMPRIFEYLYTAAIRRYVVAETNRIHRFVDAQLGIVRGGDAAGRLGLRVVGG